MLPGQHRGLCGADASAPRPAPVFFFAAVAALRGPPAPAPARQPRPCRWQLWRCAPPFVAPCSCDAMANPCFVLARVARATAEGLLARLEHTAQRHECMQAPASPLHRGCLGERCAASAASLSASVGADSPRLHRGRRCGGKLPGSDVPPPRTGVLATPTQPPTGARSLFPPSRARGGLASARKLTAAETYPNGPRTPAPKRKAGAGSGLAPCRRLGVLPPFLAPSLRPLNLAPRITCARSPRRSAASHRFMWRL